MAKLDNRKAQAFRAKCLVPTPLLVCQISVCLLHNLPSAPAVWDVHVQNPCSCHLSTEALTTAMNIACVDALA